MQPHELRVIDEHKELTTKIVALEAFMSKASFYHHLNEDQRKDLHIQLEYMLRYQKMLRIRIDKFED